MKCIIIDDEETSRVVIEFYCNKLDGVEVLEMFSNATDAINFLKCNTVDVVFLDVHMDGVSGFELLQTIIDPPRVILTTSDKSLATDAFNFDCIVDYLVKPIEFSRFKKAVDIQASYMH